MTKSAGAKHVLSDERYERLFRIDYDTLLEIGARTVELERHFNNQRGFDRSADVLPFEPEGIEHALDDYYAERGWTEDGIVPEANLAD